jgi:hypothetical protein
LNNSVVLQNRDEYFSGKELSLYQKLLEAEAEENKRRMLEEKNRKDTSRNKKKKKNSSKPRFTSQE